MLGILLVLLITVFPARADEQVWEKVNINDCNILMRALAECKSIAIIIYDGDNKYEVTLLKGDVMPPDSVVTKESYNAHKLLDKKSGDLYCMYFSGEESEGGIFLRKSKIIRLCWNKEPNRIPVRSITGEKRQRVNLVNPELYISVEELKNYLAEAKRK